MYPWYELIEGSSLLQGDFLDKCLIVVPSKDLYIPPSKEAPEIEIHTIECNVVVMSQSCDIEQDKLDLVLVCPHWSLEEMGQKDPYFKSSKAKEELRRGYLSGYHLLNKCDLGGMERDYRVVDFRTVYSLPLDFLKEFSSKIGKRIRLLPPYREQLSQAFARFFMRVGLPLDIPPFK
jgi:hypothetical protein